MDDTTVSLSNKSIIYPTSILNAVLNKFIHACPENYLIINPEKTNLMVFRSYQKTITIFPELKLAPYLIAPCDSVTCLRIHLEHILTYKSPFFNRKQKPLLTCELLSRLTAISLIMLCCIYILLLFTVISIMASFHGATRTLLTFHEFNIFKINVFALKRSL